MSELWLVLDVPYLARRADVAVGDLEHDGNPIGVLFGLMRDLTRWRDWFSTSRFVFCFDSETSKRREIRGEYKRGRGPRSDETDEEKTRRRRLREQVARLRDEDLFGLGFRNVFWADGYEADDVAASFCLHTLPENDSAVVVSGDSDLWQLISPRVSVYDPRSGKRHTLQSFVGRFGLKPCRWADVKALAGCPSDGVRGIKGIGQKTAVAFLADSAAVGRERRAAIMSGLDLWRENLRLVQLPFEGCPRFRLMEDVLSKERWMRVCERYGMKILRALYPGR